MSAPKVFVVAAYLASALMSVAAGAQTISTAAGGGAVTNAAALGVAIPNPTGTAVASDGTLYYTAGQSVYHLNPGAGTVTLVAGSGTPGFGGDGGPAVSAQLSGPLGVALDANGNLYIADTGNHVIRRVDAANGSISTVAGNRTAGYSGDGAAATSAALYFPRGIALDAAGNLYIADTYNSVIRRAAIGGTISTVAGSHSYGYGGDGGPAISALLSNPQGVAVDAAGNLYIADTNNHVIRRVAAAGGTISTVAGNHSAGYSGDGGAATSATLKFPCAIALDVAGNLYIADSSNHTMRRVAAAGGTISTVAGNHSAGFSGDGGAATSAALYFPQGVAVDASGTLYIADTDNSVIRRVAAAGATIATVAGNRAYAYGGDGGPATSAALSNTHGVALDATGNLYIADTDNFVIRRVVAAGGSISTIAGNRTIGYSGNGGPATSATLAYPNGVAVDAAGNLYIADTNNHVIRRVAAAGGAISTFAGNHNAGYSGDGGAATSAALNFPAGLAIDAAGNLYIADTSNHVIRRVAVSGTISTIAGNHSAGYSGNGGAATSASLNFPFGVALDASGNLYIADTSNHVIRRVAAAGGTISTVAGNHSAGYSGDGGAATSATLYSPQGVAVDASGNLYIADTLNSVIRRVAAAGGTISTVAGNHTAGYGGDGGAASSAVLNFPQGIAVDGAGNLYISDTNNLRVRLVSSGGGVQLPIVTASISGTLGNNGWYRSNVTVTWSVSDPSGPIISQSGCGTTVISVDTAGQVLTCSATGQGGTTTKSVTIARDTTAPTVSITTPASGASYAAGSTVNAAYSCSDGLSGSASCVGSVANGAAINTATAGTFAFAVSATDAAGNTATGSVSYTVLPSTAAFTTTPTSLNFGSQKVNVASAPRPVTVTNTGQAALPLTSITISGRNSSQFSQTNNCGTSLALGAACTINVVFRPTSARTRSATLNVNAGGGAGTQRVTLSGTGIP
jgi:trimeric autotransporter adhesin